MLHASMADASRMMMMADEIWSFALCFLYVVCMIFPLARFAFVLLSSVIVVAVHGLWRFRIEQTVTMGYNLNRDVNYVGKWERYGRDLKMMETMG